MWPPLINTLDKHTIAFNILFIEQNIHKYFSSSVSQLQCTIDRYFKCEQCIIEDMTNLENFHLKEK